MIHVDNLIKDYGNRRALNNISFDIQGGEIVGFLGPNGAGKTTTMRILTTYLPPSYGKVEIDGHDVIDDSLQVRKIVGYVPETVPLYSDMTVLEYLVYMAGLRNIKSPVKRANEVLALVNLSDRSSGYIGKLSKGMRQRLGLAQALLHNPQVLILDEPTIGLDPAQIIEVRNLIREVGKEHTVLLSTHILPEAQQVCDRILIINNGEIVVDDTTDHLQTHITGGNRVSLKIRGAEIQEVASLVNSIPGINCVDIMDDVTLEFDCSAMEDARPAVARAVITAGYDLVELKTLNLSLEEIFLKLTRDEPSTPEFSGMPESDTLNEER